VKTGNDWLGSWYAVLIRKKGGGEDEEGAE